MDNEIVIKNLPPDFYVSDLCHEFGRFGNIVSAWVRTDDSSNEEACVTFEAGFSALEAVKRMDEKRLRGRSIRVTTSYENQCFKKVFVKSFSATWEEDDLVKAFGQFGPIKKAQVFGSGGASNGYGCVEFEMHTTAKRAIDAMNGTEIGGHKLVVERFKSKAERDNFELNSLEHIQQRLRDSAQRDNLLVQNLPVDMEETELRKLFLRFGNILSVKIMVDGKGRSKGFGFVSFQRKEDAARALRKMNGRSVRGDRILKVNFKEDGELRERFKRLKSMMEQKAVHNHYKARSKSSTSVFVPHLVERNMMGARLNGNF